MNPNARPPGHLMHDQHGQHVPPGPHGHPAPHGAPGQHGQPAQQIPGYGGPGGYPQGGYPPSYAPPPGNYPPGAYPPMGGYPPGHYPPGPGGYPPQSYPPGAYAPPQQPPPAYGQQRPGISLNPLNLLTSVSQMGQNVQMSQQYVSSKVSWFTGGFFQQLFHVDPPYVKRKLLLLLAPYLRAYDYTRQASDMGSMKPPRQDLYAPDLYIPLYAVFTYVFLTAVNRFMNGKFTPDVMYHMFSWACMCWTFNFGLMWVFTKLMQLQLGPPLLELVAYSGYSFLGYCISIICGWLAGRSLGWYTAWVYTSGCTALFLIRTFKQILRFDSAQRGVPVSAHLPCTRLGMLACVLECFGGFGVAATGAGGRPQRQPAACAPKAVLPDKRHSSSSLILPRPLSITVMQQCCNTKVLMQQPQ